MTTQDELNSIVKTLADTGLVSKIILFGSLAHGKEKAEIVNKMAKTKKKKVKLTFLLRGRQP